MAKSGICFAVRSLLSANASSLRLLGCKYSSSLPHCDGSHIHVEYGFEEPEYREEVQKRKLNRAADAAAAPAAAVAAQTAAAPRDERQTADAGDRKSGVDSSTSDTATVASSSTSPSDKTNAGAS